MKNEERRTKNEEREAPPSRANGQPTAVRTGVVLDLTEDGCPQSPGDMIRDS